MLACLERVALQLAGQATTREKDPALHRAYAEVKLVGNLAVLETRAVHQERQPEAGRQGIYGPRYLGVAQVCIGGLGTLATVEQPLIVSIIKRGTPAR